MTQMFEEHSTLMHVTAALTAGRPVFGFLGWLVRSHLPYEEGAGSHLPYKEGLSRSLSTASPSELLARA